MTLCPGYTVPLSLLGTAWNLEDDDEAVSGCSMDGVPFGYTTGGLYYSADEHLQTLHTLVGVKAPSTFIHFFIILMC